MANLKTKPGDCFKQALMAANVTIPSDLFIPDFITIEDAESVCNRLGLELIREGSVSLGVEPVIVIHQSGRNRHHATFVHDIGALLDRNIKIFGLVRLQNN